MRGRGRGREIPKQEPVISFPEGVTLPVKKDLGKEEDNLARRSFKLHSYFKASPYYSEEAITKKGEIKDIERYSDRKKVNTTIKRDSLLQILELKRFPSELIEGSKGWHRQPSRKRVRWNPDSELQKLDILEKLEQLEGENEKEEEEEEENEEDEKEKEEEKKEGENEEEDEDQENEGSEEEEAGNDDYIQNVDFDDDEDEFNIEDDGDDEQTY